MGSTDGQSLEADLAQRQHQIYESAETQEELAGICIQEVSLLLERLKPQFKSPLQSTGLPTFIRTLQREHDALRSLVAELSSSDAISEDSVKAHARRLEVSYNVVSRSVTQWHRLKRCRSFVAMNQAFQGSSRDERRRELAKLEVAGSDKQGMHRVLKEKARVEVDVVEGGREWLTVKALQRDRLARQLSDCGWAWGDHELGDRVDEDEWEDVPLAKFFRRLVVAARMNRHEYRFPRIRLVLSSLTRENDELDIFIDQLVRLDPLVQVIIEYQDGPFMSAPVPDLETAISNLVGDELEDLTPTLNLDHTVLIDLISDLTHASLEPQAWQARTTRAQIEEENSHQGGLMVPTLYPLLRGRKLVCTKEAAEHFHNVLGTVGTETERERGRLLVPWGDQTGSMPVEAVRDRFQQLSIHQLPGDVQLPLKIVQESWDIPSISEAISSGALPAVALDVAQCSAFKSSKLSIFMYGWAAGVATVTSNKEVRGQIRTWIETNRRSDTEVGPLIWKIDVTRNLLAKNASPRPGTFSKRNGDNHDEGSEDDDH